jgi:hypothetical protein
VCILAYVHKIHFEKEFEILVNVWRSLADLTSTTLALRPVLDSIDPIKSEEERKLERLNNFSDSYMDFYEHVEKFRPFYPSDIYQTLLEISSIAQDEAYDYRLLSHLRSDRNYRKDYWEKAVKNSEKIINGIDKVCEDIRARVTDYSLEIKQDTESA